MCGHVTLPRLVVLDLAGTTVDDRDNVPAAFAAALATIGVVPTAEQLKLVRGASKREALLRFVPEGADRIGVADAVYATFRSDLARRYRQGGVRAVAGAEHTIAALRDGGMRVALNTGFDRVITDLILTSLGWTQQFVDAVVCGDDVPEGRPAPHLIRHAMAACGVAAPNEVANVGDTVLDLEAGDRAGVAWNVGVLTGAHDRARLAQAPHTHIIASVRELAQLWPPLSA